MTGSSFTDYGNVDWNEVWRARQQRHEASVKFQDPTHNWDKKENAERYSEGSRGEFDARIQMTVSSLCLEKRYRVLDIGAGPGTLAIPIAPLVQEVTAIEPGRGMAEILEENIRNGGLSNVSCVRKLWEDIDPERDLSPPYDLVLCSLALTMEDLKAALEKMDGVSSGYVCIYWFANPPFWEQMYLDLWPGLHGEPYHAGPKADCLFCVLYQMGIFANVEMMPLSKEYRFRTEREMTTFFRRRFWVKTQKQKRVLDEYLASLIHRDKDAFIISGNSVLAKVWWKKG